MNFASDNAGGVHPRIMAALAAANDGHVPAYGGDRITRAAQDLLREVFDAPDAAVHFVPTGTAANALSLSLLAPGPAAAQVGQRLQEDRERAAASVEIEDGDDDAAARATTLADVFGDEAVVDARPFRQAVKRAYEDPLLDRKRVDRVWERRTPEDAKPERDLPRLEALARLLALLA